MATPNSSFPELLSTTVQLLDGDGELFDNILTKSALTATLKEYGAVRSLDGGPQVVIPIQFAENGSYKRYSGSEILNVTSNDVFSSFNYPWYQSAISVQISGREMLQNSGRAQSADLLKSRVQNAKDTFQNQLNIDLLSDGTATNQVVGLQTLIAALPTSGTVGGVSRSTYSFAQNQYYRATTDGGAALNASNIVQNMDQLDTRIQAYRGKTKVIISDDVTFRYFEGSVNPLQRLNPQEGKLGKLGFNTYAYKQAEVVFEPSVSGMPSTTQYWIDPDVMDLITHKDRNLTQLPMRDSFNQDLAITFLASMFTLGVKNFRRLGTLNNN